MAVNKTTTKTATKATRTTSKAKTEPVTEENTETIVKTSVAETPKYRSSNISTIPNDALIPVTSLLEGQIIYESTVTVGYRAEWNGFGDTIELEFKELKSMAATQIRFFSEPWISIPEDVIKALRVERYYTNVGLTPVEFEELFTKPVNEITSTIRGLSAGYKNAVRLRAKAMIESREIDSIAIKEAIEEGLGRPLYEQ